MKVQITKHYNEDLPNEFATATVDAGRNVKASKRYWFWTGHSPIRMFKYFIKLKGLKTFISVHLVRHKIGVEHAVTSKRTDLRVNPDELVTRDTPVVHVMDINAQSLMSMAEKRLCLKSHSETVGVMRRIKKEIAKVEPELAPFLVPHCVSHGSICPEKQICSPGIAKVMSCYMDYPLMPKHIKDWIKDEQKTWSRNKCK